MGSTSSEPSKVRRDRLIEAYLPLVRSVARRYRGRGEPFEDLVQVGTIGLIKASDRYDPDRGVAFETFATTAIEGEIRRHLRDRTPSLRIPRELQKISGKLRRAEGDLAAALGRTPTVPELATALSAEQRDIERARAAERARDSVRFSVGDEAIELPDAAEPIAGSDDRLLLARGARALDERERQIVFLRFHADMTERQIAGQVGISQAHVSRLLDGALAKLRAELTTSEQADSASDAAVSPPSSRSSRFDAREREGPDTRIATVSASQQKTTLARYLELPYHVAVTSKREGERPSWSATVEELPGCGARGRSPDEAVVRLRAAMETWLASALAENREIPIPGREAPKSEAAPSHSGRFLVRMSSSLHEQLADAAEREHVSLNRFVTDTLARSVGEGTEGPMASQPQAEVTDSDRSARPGAARGLRLALATNLIVVALAGIIAVVLLVIALERGI